MQLSVTRWYCSSLVHLPCCETEAKLAAGIFLALVVTAPCGGQLKTPSAKLHGSAADAWGPVDGPSGLSDYKSLRLTTAVVVIEAIYQALPWCHLYDKPIVHRTSLLPFGQEL